MDISFVILTWNSEEYIERCISSITHCLRDNRYNYEIIIVDNASEDNSVSILNNLKRLQPEIVKPVFLDNNTGTTYSRNMALQKATGKYIIVNDSDVEMTDGSIQKLIPFLDSNERIGLVVPKLIYPNGSVQKSTDQFPTAFSKLYRIIFLKLTEFFENTREESANSREVDYAISAMWVFKRELLDYVGYLDEKFFYAPEDVDYCLRIWKAGYRILYVPEVCVVHDAQEISRGLKITRGTIDHVKGLIYYFMKHGYFIKRPKIRCNVRRES